MLPPKDGDEDPGKGEHGRGPDRAGQRGAPDRKRAQRESPGDESRAQQPGTDLSADHVSIVRPRGGLCGLDAGLGATG